MKKLLAGIMALHVLLQAQDSMTADVMRSDGKIYVVIIVAAIVITVAGIYMITIDRKVSRLEKKMKEKN